MLRIGCWLMWMKSKHDLFVLTAARAAAGQAQCPWWPVHRRVQLCTKSGGGKRRDSHRLR